MPKDRDRAARGEDREWTPARSAAPDGGAPVTPTEISQRRLLDEEDGRDRPLAGGTQLPRERS
ncbi:hypothetical protein [Anaeromyxobacter oryzae]|uniref:Uncharacterized protein n=1 Tax=Anaeromyxobacter oryzae TaxID=2918170 RepID=A0ABN6MV06_9BACT|nr:hypothetical protein [Anaeromyxobacter oryzae]BDG04090.1 hypothetical protein AMOR_30860 [Anaeromyxobacter oryzae]